MGCDLSLFSFSFARYFNPYEVVVRSTDGNCVESPIIFAFSLTLYFEVIPNVLLREPYVKTDFAVVSETCRVLHGR